MGGRGWGGHGPSKIQVWSHADNASCTRSILVQCVVFSDGKAGGSVRLLQFDVTEERHGGKICVVYCLPKHGPPIQDAGRKLCIFVFTLYHPYLVCTLFGVSSLLIITFLRAIQPRVMVLHKAT